MKPTYATVGLLLGLAFFGLAPTAAAEEDCVGNLNTSCDNSDCDASEIATCRSVCIANVDSSCARNAICIANVDVQCNQGICIANVDTNCDEDICIANVDVECGPPPI